MGDVGPSVWQGSDTSARQAIDQNKSHARPELARGTERRAEVVRSFERFTHRRTLRCQHRRGDIATTDLTPRNFIEPLRVRIARTSSPIVRGKHFAEAILSRRRSPRHTAFDPGVSDSSATPLGRRSPAEVSSKAGPLSQAGQKLSIHIPHKAILAARHVPRSDRF